MTYPKTKNRRRVVCPTPPALVRLLGALPGPRVGLVVGRRWRNCWHSWWLAIARANVLLAQREQPLIPPRARIYSLRHSRATHLARAGVRAKAVADLLEDRVSMVEQWYYGMDVEGIRDGLAIAAASSSLGALEAGRSVSLVTPEVTKSGDATGHCSVPQRLSDDPDASSNSSPVNQGGVAATKLGRLAVSCWRLAFSSEAPSAAPVTRFPANT